MDQPRTVNPPRRTGAPDGAGGAPARRGPCRIAPAPPGGARVAPRLLAAATGLALSGCAALSSGPDGLRSIGAGLAAHGVCSGAYVAGRPWNDVLADDVLPASPILKLLDVQGDDASRTVVARMPGVPARTARWRPDRGCVLEPPPGGDGGAQASTAGVRSAVPSAAAATSVAGTPAPATGSPPRTAAVPPPAAFPLPPRDAPWPAGDRALEPRDWGPSVDAVGLQAAVDDAFVGAGDPKAANARAVAVVHRGRLLVDRGAPGFPPGTPLHGWSMTKTVVGMLAHQLAAEGRLDLDATVVDALGGPRGPEWRDAWRADPRARITVKDLLYMRDGLDQLEDYSPGAAVTRMLYGTGDVAAFAARAPAQAPPGERWRYLSATTNLLSRVIRASVASDEAYWRLPRTVLFDPVGARTATLETDADGTWIGSSFLWASAADWARLGELTLRDGRWGDRQVLAPGWLARASAPATADGPGRGYGAHAWRIGDEAAGRCRGRVPADTVAMSGHWGQVVAVVPSREAVIVRMGWTFDRERFSDCAFLERVLAALR